MCPYYDPTPRDSCASCHAREPGRSGAERHARRCRDAHASRARARIPHTEHTRHAPHTPTPRRVADTQTVQYEIVDSTTHAAAEHHGPHAVACPQRRVEARGARLEAFCAALRLIRERIRDALHDVQAHAACGMCMCITASPQTGHTVAARMTRAVRQAESHRRHTRRMRLTLSSLLLSLSLALRSTESLTCMHSERAHEARQWPRAS